MSDSLASLRLGDTHAYFAFDEEPSKDITCAVCLEPWQHPVEITPCGHIFCEACVPPPRSRSETQKCPMCRAEVQAKAPPNRALSNIIAGLATSCTRCEWKGEYAQFQRHDCTAGDEHKLPRRTTPTATVTTRNTVEEDAPLLFGDGLNTQQEGRPQRRFYGKEVVITLVIFLVIIVPVAIYLKNRSHHDDHDEPDTPPTPSGTPAPPQPPLPHSPYDCSERWCKSLYCQGVNATGFHHYDFVCTEGDYNTVGSCSESAAIPNCKQTCNTRTCMWWQQCPDSLCKERATLPVCPNSKPIRCIRGPASGTCSDEPDISFCSDFCNIRTCDKPSF